MRILSAPIYITSYSVVQPIHSHIDQHIRRVPIERHHPSEVHEVIQHRPQHLIPAAVVFLCRGQVAHAAVRIPAQERKPPRARLYSQRQFAHYLVRYADKRAFVQSEELHRSILALTQNALRIKPLYLGKPARTVDARLDPRFIRDFMRVPHIGHVGPEFAAPYVHVQAVNVLLLYSVESTSASSARGFVRGEFYTQDGVLVASTVQEGVMRNHN